MGSTQVPPSRRVGPPSERKPIPPRGRRRRINPRRPPLRRNPQPAHMLHHHHTAPRSRHRRRSEQLRPPQTKRQPQNPPTHQPRRQHPPLRQRHRISIRIQRHHPTIQTRHHPRPTLTPPGTRLPSRPTQRHVASRDQPIHHPRREAHRNASYTVCRAKPDTRIAWSFTAPASTASRTADNNSARATSRAEHAAR